jgi:DNA-directed RNA polymerase subunit RPC12/RpoP
MNQIDIFEAARCAVDAYELLAKAGAKVTYFCAYCGYEFGAPPKLPAKCPRCGRKLTDYSKPEVEPARLRVQKR